MEETPIINTSKRFKVEPRPDIPVPPPPRPQTIVEYYKAKYGENFNPEQFITPSGNDPLFQAQACSLLFAIFQELKELNDKVK
jgi:hypothetical protein